MTGDIARIDDDGFLFITGRISRFSKIGGEMVPHLRIEEAIGLDGACVVIGVPDAQRGERLAVLYTTSDTEPVTMIDRLRTAGLPALWIPKKENFYRVGAIPTLGTGKTGPARRAASWPSLSLTSRRISPRPSAPVRLSSPLPRASRKEHNHGSRGFCSRFCGVVGVDRNLSDRKKPSNSSLPP